MERKSDVRSGDVILNQPPCRNWKTKKTQREREFKEHARIPWYCLGQRDQTARFTLYIGILTGALVIVGVLQWGVILGQLTEMRSGGVDTHNLALAAKLDQRAWVGYANLVLNPPKIGDVVHASVSYINSGRTPAKNVYPLTHLRFMPNLIISESQLIELAKDGNATGPMLGVIYPGVQSTTLVNGNNPVNETDMAAFEVSYTYLWGEVAYTDVFDEPHTMEFCAYRKRLTGDFQQCAFHNEPDHQKNPN
jgi:hypothetical protein